jgi:hypothetical protein
MREGRLVACDIVWAELAAVFPSREELVDAVKQLGIDFLPMTSEAAVQAGVMWREYRSRGGRRNRIIADFLIAAHAVVQCDRLLNRDRGFCHAYFKDLAVVDLSVVPRPQSDSRTPSGKRHPRNSRR